MPSFSVIIPTYTRSVPLRRTIESVLLQTCTDFEIIIVDDGSTDNTQAVVQELCDSRIHYYWIQNSGGPATPRNKGIDEAVADWICFLDSDDLWYPTKLERIDQEIIASQDIDALSNDEIMSFSISGKKKILRYGPFTQDFYREMLLYGNRCSTSAMTVKKSFLNNHSLRFNTSPDYVIVEDYDLWLRMALNGANFQFIREPLGEYLIEDDNISKNLTRLRDNLIRLQHDHVFQIQNFDQNRELLWRAMRSRSMSANAVADLRESRWLLALENLMQATSVSPRTTFEYFFSRLHKIYGTR